MKHHHPENDADAAQLAALGHHAELNRNFSPLAMLGLAFAILNSWTALAASLSLALPSGGPTSVLWGLISEYSSLTKLAPQMLIESSCWCVQSIARCVSRRIPFRLSDSWRSISLGCSYKLEEMGADSKLDYRMDQRIRLDRVGCLRRTAWESIDCRSHFIDAPKLFSSEVAPIPDIYRVQRRCIRCQYFHDCGTALGYEVCIYLVDSWICRYLYHSFGMCFAKLFYCGIRLHGIHQ